MSNTYKEKLERKRILASIKSGYIVCSFLNWPITILEGVPTSSLGIRYDLKR